MHWQSFFWGVSAGFVTAFIFSAALIIIGGAEEALFGEKYPVPDKVEPLREDDEFEAFI